MAVRITPKKVQEHIDKIARRFSVFYHLQRIDSGLYFIEYTEAMDDTGLLFSGSLREITAWLDGAERGLEKTAPAVSDEVLRHINEAEDYDFEDALLRTEQMLEYFQEHTGTLPMPVAEVALTAMETIAKTINNDLTQRIKGNYSHNIISCSLMAMCHTLTTKHQFSEEDAHQITNLIIEAAPIITTLYDIHPEGSTP